MTQDNKHPVPRDRGFIKNIGDDIRLVFRLMAEPRVGWWLKVLPFASLLYFIFPDIAPGPIDDALVIGIGFYMFIELCPPDVVEEHRQALRSVIPGEWRDAEDSPGERTIEGKFKNK